MIGKFRSIVLDAADHKGLADFYRQLLGLEERHADDEWITLVGPDADGPRLCVQAAPDHQPPGWRDPARPQQAHLDIMTTDMDAEAERAVSLGARRLDGGGDSWHVLADPAGHPFCVCQTDREADHHSFWISLDTADAKSLAAFYAELFGLPVTYEGDIGSMIGTDGTSRIMFVNNPDYTPPRWPDPNHPQQFHLDVGVDDVDAAEKQVLAIGATKVEDNPDGNFKVYTDPSGHPFCLCF